MRRSRLLKSSRNLSEIPNSCFNPCFLGTRPRTIPLLASIHLLFAVSILVFVEVALGPWDPGICDGDLHVSILVFVEVALGRPRYHRCRKPCTRSFNPCFRGSRPRTLSGAPIFPHRLVVSILVFVEVALGLEYEKSEEANLLFQSLFSWKSPSDAGQGTCTGLPIRVSILVFVEVALGLPGGSQRLSYRLVSILVFVEVALGRKDRVMVGKNPTGFNPCFRGSRPRTSKYLEYLCTSVSFNPCFRGSRPRTSYDSRRGCNSHVSILVFVEVALGHNV